MQGFAFFCVITICGSESVQLRRFLCTLDNTTSVNLETEVFGRIKKRVTFA